MLPSACGLWQHFQDLGHSFSPYGPPSRQITYIYCMLLCCYYAIMSGCSHCRLNDITYILLMSWYSDGEVGLTVPGHVIDQPCRVNVLMNQNLEKLSGSLVRLGSKFCINVAAAWWFSLELQAATSNGLSILPFREGLAYGEELILEMTFQHRCDQRLPPSPY